MLHDPDSARRRRRADFLSLGVVAGFAWTLACLLLTGGSDLAASAIVLRWLGGLAVVACAAAVALRIREGRLTRR